MVKVLPQRLSAVAGPGSPHQANRRVATSRPHRGRRLRADPTGILPSVTSRTQGTRFSIPPCPRHQPNSALASAHCGPTLVIAYSTSRGSFPSRLTTRSSRHTCPTSGQSRESFSCSAPLPQGQSFRPPARYVERGVVTTWARSSTFGRKWPRSAFRRSYEPDAPFLFRLGEGNLKNLKAQLAHRHLDVGNVADLLAE